MQAVVVFLVLSHHKPKLVERLVERLVDTREAITVVHHDRKAPDRPSMPDTGRAICLPDPLTVTWGGLSQIQSTLRAMRWIRREIPAVGWIIALSGQDYPAMNPRKIESQLLSSDADAFIQWEWIPPIARKRSSDWQRGMARRYYRHRIPGRYTPIPLPRLRFFVDGVGVFAGSSWWTLGRRSIDRILDDHRMIEYLLRRRFRTTFIPDEAFFQTALLNSPHDLKLVNNGRRFYRFPPEGGSGHPDILTIRDVDAILTSNAFFARKVDEVISRELLDRLDEGTTNDLLAR